MSHFHAARRGAGGYPRVLAVLASVCVLWSLPTVGAAAATSTSPASSAEPTGASVPGQDRDRQLAPGWRQSADRSVTTDGDQSGLHLLVADAKDGYTWRTAATLAEPAAETDQWIGQQCVTASGRYAAVVYAPREFVNREEKFRDGGLAAIVDVETGEVRKLPFTVNLAYYNPGCGADERVVFTRNFMSAETYKSRLVTVDAVTARIVRQTDATGQVTSAVPYGNRVVAAAAGGLADVTTDGKLRHVADVLGTPFRLSVDKDGVAYEVRTGAGTEIHRYTPAGDVTVAVAPTDTVRLHQVAGHVVVQGPAISRLSGTRIPAGWKQIDAPVDAQPSSTAALTVLSATNVRDESSAQPVHAVPGGALPVRITAKVTVTGAQPTFVVKPDALRQAAGIAPSPAMATAPAGARLAAGDLSTTTTDPDRACAVPRNDPKIQSMQPTPEMGEWAADLAVKGQLTIQRPAGWNGTTLPAYTPQGLFPSHPLIGGGQVPAQVLLGVMAQESNMWQAGPNATDGESGNFNQGGFYGRGVGVNSINWSTADCGYGATQVTTGMAVADGTSVYTSTQQVALTVDYAANIAAGLQILQDKWNQIKQLGVSVNNGDPSKIENWWYALWAYNSGWHAQGADASGAYGLGWGNNVANEDFPADRDGFLDAGFGDAKYPNHWAYPERVLGWARHPLLRLDWKAGTYGAAYRPALWPNSGAAQRPPLGTFCATAVQCDMNQIHKPSQYPSDPGSHCLRDDLKCWWHVSSTWTNCPTGCGAENLRYQPGSAEPGVAASKVLYWPDCAAPAQVPAGSLIIDDVPGDVTTSRGCTKEWVNHGTLSFKFAADTVGHYPSKIDFHQVDGGLGGHMWSAHAWRDSTANAKHRVTGTWTLDRQLNGWARVLVYIPDHRARTPQAIYTVHGSDSTSPSRSIVEGNYLDEGRNPAPGQWESIGAFNFTGTPSVSLDNFAHLEVDDAWADDIRDVPWDAVAFQPLPGKPANQVVALGDSYASGEGASGNPVNGVWSYYRSSDHDGRDDNGDDHTLRDACHRSPSSWSHQAFLPDNGARSVGLRASTFDPTLNYHMSACTGATTRNLLPTGSGQYQEGQQADQGYLDQYTSLVTFSIGGNDARFTPIFKQCVLSVTLCQNQTFGNDTEPLSAAEPKVIDKIGPNLQNVLSFVKGKAPNAKILVMGYPVLLEGLGQCIAGIGTEEAPWMNEMNNRLDDVLKAAVAQAKAVGVAVTYADPRSAFAGKAACSADNEQIHAVVLSLTRGDDTDFRWGDTGFVSAQTLHPTVEGAKTYSVVATGAIAGM